MTPLEAGLLAALIALPFHWLVQRELAKLDDPAYLRRHGVVILNTDVLQHSGAIGIYGGQEIWSSVTFKGMLYRFHHVSRREHAGPLELYVAPGVVYRTQ